MYYPTAASQTAALDAARKAVAALDDGSTIPASDGIFEALAAIDALRGEANE